LPGALAGSFQNSNIVSKNAKSFDTKAPRRILVIKLRHLGDVLLSTPVFAALKQRFPGAEIHVTVNSGTAAILEGNSDVTSVEEIPGGRAGRSLLRGIDELRFLWKMRKRGFDLAIDLTTSDRSALLARFSGAPRRLGYRSRKGFLGRSLCYTEVVQPARGDHIILKHARILKPLGIETSRQVLSFPVSERERAAVRQIVPARRDFFQVHPVSRIEEKNWPMNYIAEVVNALSARGWLPVITGSADPSERRKIAGLRTKLAGESLDLSGQLTIKQLGAVSERARFFLGVDTAPMHIAAAVGVPVIAIFGPTSENLWAPWCERKLILSRDLPCRCPCKNKHGCPHIECLREFTPAMVMPRIEKFLSMLDEIKP
jgi:heptosyltransferase-3